MDASSVLSSFVQMQQINGKPAYAATSQASEQFSSILNHVVSRDQSIIIAASHEAQSQSFQKQKEHIEDGQNMQPEDEENESIYKTVKKIERKLINLSRIERQMMAGF